MYATINRDKANIAAMANTNAVGSALPSLLVFKGEKKMKFWGKQHQQAGGYHSNENGWMTSDLFLKWLEHCFFLYITKL